MARYIGPKNRLARREGVDLFLKSVLSKRSGQLERDFAPGQHGANTRGKQSNFGLQLREKQKVKRIYGVLEKQFRNYFKKAAKSKGVTGAELLCLLERRLDNVLYRTGLTVTRAHARQVVSHGAVKVNGRKVNIASFQVSALDEISLNVKPERAKRVQETYKEIKDSVANSWIDVNDKDLAAKVMRLPERSDIQFPVEEQLIVELYSK
ncbi:MAG: small subunit ribosomal protein S4 [Candidatus Omnitrophota bacterium]|jgi:small subunit ribosomal protein S4